MNIKETITKLLEDFIADDIREIFSKLLVKDDKYIISGEETIKNHIFKTIESNYDGLKLSDKNKHVISKTLTNISSSDIVVCHLRLNDMFITLLNGDLGLVDKYKMDCTACLNAEIISYADHTPIILNAVILLDSKIDNSLHILCHELVHLLIKYNKIICDKDIMIEDSISEEFICDIISHIAMNGNIWNPIFEKFLDNVTEEYKEFYIQEYEKLK